jgi:chitodextrinase
MTVGANEIEPAPEAPPPRLGERTAAVVLLNFEDDHSQPFTPADALEWTFASDDSVRAWYDDVSFGRLSLIGSADPAGDVHGWVTIDRGDGCDHVAWGRAAEEELAERGVSTAGYDHVVFAFPRTAACAFLGAAFVNGRESYVNGPATARNWLEIVAHELGHNLGTMHASSWGCENHEGVPVAISYSCQISEYGDPFDMMGHSNRHHMNAHHKAAVGFLDLANVATVAAAGRYRVAPVEWRTDGVQLLRVPFDKDESGAVRYYELEYRQPTALDDFAAGDPVVNGVTIRVGHDPELNSSTWLVDTTPETSSRTDAPLVAGATFRDEARQIAFEVISASPAEAVVDVGFVGFRYNWAACSGTVAPARVEAGRPFPVELQLQNTGTTTWDGSAAAGYHAQVWYPQGAVGRAVLDPAEVVEPGRSGRMVGQLTAPYASGPTVFHWDVRQQLQRFGEPCSITVEVVDELQSPDPPTNLRVIGVTEAVVELTWGAAVDNVGVSGYRIYRGDAEGFLLVGDVPDTSYRDSEVRPAVHYGYYVVAYDASGNASAPSDVIGVDVPDQSPPSSPAGLTVTERAETSLALAWTASTDNVDVAGYRVFRGDALGTFVLVGDTRDVRFTDSGLAPLTLYRYRVVAYDAAGNLSPPSQEVLSVTQLCPVAGLCV